MMKKSRCEKHIIHRFSPSTLLVFLVVNCLKQTTKTAVAAAAALSTNTNTIVTGVTLKLALDQNWAVADGPLPSSSPSSSLQQLPARFTCAASLDLVHRLRRDCQGVLVGRTTVQRDDCSLTVRRVPLHHPQQSQPTRVIIDPRLSLLLPTSMSSTTSSSSSTTLTTSEIKEGWSIPPFQIFHDGYPTILYHTNGDVDANLLNSQLPSSVQCIYLPPSFSNSDSPLTEEFHSHHRSSSSSWTMSPFVIWNHLQQHFGMSHILIEGGPTTALHFLPIVDRILLIRAPLVFHNQPVVSSHLSRERLQQAGFQYQGNTMSGGIDTLEYWTRPHVSWPTPILSDWP